jgi:cytochrome c oxidase subunit II
VPFVVIFSAFACEYSAAYKIGTSAIFMPLLLFITIILLTLATALLFIYRQWLPFLAATAGSAFDHQLHLTLAAFGIALLLVQLALAIFIWKFRRPGKRSLSRRSYGWPALEIAIVLFTGAVFLTLGIKGGALSVSQAKVAEPQALQIEVTGMQFQWYFRYPGADDKFGQTRPELVDASIGNPLGLDSGDPAAHDDIVAPQLVVPVNRPVELTLRSQDVVHSLFVPTMRQQMNAVPGLTTHTSFTPTQTGTFEVVCSQLCGLGHYRMHGTVNVLTAEQFEKWLAAKEHR